MPKQKTVAQANSVEGIGIHTANRVTLTIHPAPPNTGIIFRRTDLYPVREIPVCVEYMTSMHFSTTLCKDDVSVMTIEHFLSALSGLGIDNLYIDLNAEELPILDGSAEPFILLLQSSGIVAQNAEKEFIKIQRKIFVQEDDAFAMLEPYEGFKINIQIDFKHPLLNTTNQMATFDFTEQLYIKEIARARTFGFLSDYEYLKKKNLALGASLENTIVFDEQKILNPEGLRYPDEWIRHKILDAIGDLYCLGHPVMGAFTGYKSGHALNARLLHCLSTDRKAWVTGGLPLKFQQSEAVQNFQYDQNQ